MAQEDSIEGLLEYIRGLKERIDKVLVEMKAKIASNEVILASLPQPTRKLWLLTRNIFHDMLLLAVCTSKEKTEEFKKQYIAQISGRDVPSLYAFYWYRQTRNYRLEARSNAISPQELNKEIEDKWQKDIETGELGIIRNCRRQLEYYIARNTPMHDSDEKQEEETNPPNVNDLDISGDIHKHFLYDSTDDDLEITPHKALENCYSGSFVSLVGYYPCGDTLMSIKAITPDAVRAKAITAGLHWQNMTNGNSGGYHEYSTHEFPVDELVWE